eukprot:CAMPEP_0196131652 /NCGR_PEP_ID=MMETSP0910-20130528/1564_1 /TAXON_ID=49265 /ORGANISM="Thalassiosira rotula, Strain GSO102" /LENGTH=147 /DNA_ID=CAMNT_0041391135 /DNA_START=128 /DNA_END=571 /DNA_ORIENTATION=+
MAEQASPDWNATPSTPTNDGAASPKKSTNDPLLQSIKQFVNLTNSALSTFEQATDESSTMVVSRLRQLGTQTRHIAARAMSTYDHRAQYGPQIVAGTAVFMGGIMALRTRRMPVGVVAGGLGGAAAYGNIYGYEDHSAPSWRNSLPK